MSFSKTELFGKADLVSVALLTVFVLTVFSSTVFFGKEISRIGTLTQRDTMFGRLAKGAYDPMDTCIYQEHGPNYHLTESVIASGNLPLWNPYLGLGCPLWADSQILAFSPITWLQAPFASMRVYNLLMVFHVWLGAVAVYFFGRLLKLSPCASLLASSSYSFCPNILYMFEWNRCQSAFFSMPFVGFAYLWRRQNALSVLICSVLCVSMVVSGHAVPSFFAILLASTMFLVLSYFLPHTHLQSNLDSEISRKFSIEPLKNFAMVGVLTFLLAAPFLVPFLEGVKASDTFKSTQGYVRYVVRSTALLPSLLFPFHGAGSPYPGAVTLILALSAFFIAEKNRAFVRIFVALTVISLCILTRPGPFDLVFQLPYLSWFMTIYAIPSLFLFVAILGGAGFDALIDSTRKLRSALIVFGAALLPFAMPFVFKSFHFDSSQMVLNDWLKTMTVSSSLLLKEGLVLAGALMIAFAMIKISNSWIRRAAVILIILNVASLSFVFSKSLPANPAFVYEEVEPIKFFKNSGSRVVSMGRHVLVPNTGQVYAISNLLSFMPTHPKGMLGFLEKSNVTIEGVGQYAERPLTKLIDAASIKYAIATEPVLSVDDRLPLPCGLAGSDGISYGNGLKLRSYASEIDGKNRDLIGTAGWFLEKPAQNKKSLSYVSLLVREDGSLVWIGDRHPVDVLPSFSKLPEPSGNADANYVSSSSFTIVSACIPNSVRVGEKVCHVLQVIDNSSGELIEPSNVPPEMKHNAIPKSLVLKRFQVPAADAVGHPFSKRHFNLVKETTPEMVRVYENSRALPQAYLITKTRTVESISDAMSEMLKPEFSPANEALVEKAVSLDANFSPSSNNALEKNARSKPDSYTSVDLPQVSRPNVNEVLVNCNASVPSLLVLTDAVFPGWKCTVDGNDSEIIRTDGVFRGVQITPGKHVVRFFYEPASLKIGFALFILGLVTAALFLRLCNRQAPKSVSVT